VCYIARARLAGRALVTSFNKNFLDT